MRTTSVKRYSSGFCLNETELRRIVDASKECLVKINEDLSIEERYEVMFQNGTKGEGFSLDDILNLENHGRGKIIALSMEFFHLETRVNKEDEDGKNKAKVYNYIEVLFNDCSKEPIRDYYAIYCRIFGESRDWTHLTSSIIQERIDKIKRRSYWLNLLRYPTNLISLLFVLAFVIGIVADTHYQSIIKDDNVIRRDIQSTTDSLYSLSYYEEMKLLKDTLRSNNYIDFYVSFSDIRSGLSKSNRFYRDSLIRVHEMEVKEKRNIIAKFYDLFPSNALGLYVGLFSAVIFSLSYVFLKEYYPLYNFVWGDYEQVFEKKKSVLRYLLYTVCLGILLSILANKLTDLF